MASTSREAPLPSSQLNVVLIIPGEPANISPMLVHMKSQVNAPSDPTQVQATYWQSGSGPGELVEKLLQKKKKVCKPMGGQRRRKLRSRS